MALDGGSINKNNKSVSDWSIQARTRAGERAACVRFFPPTTATVTGTPRKQ